MGAYCGNNPISNIDPNGTYYINGRWQVMGRVPGADYYCYNCGGCDPAVYPNAPKGSSSKPDKKPNVATSTSSSPPSLPKTGQPNSKSTLHNPDGSIKQERWYGPDGLPIRDRDYNHGGDMPFPHDHEWKDGVRGKEHLEPSPDYEFSWDEDIFNKRWHFNFNFNPPMGDKLIWENAWEDIKRIFS